MEPTVTRPDTRPAADGVDIPTALARLADAGIPEKVLTSHGVDITDPAALRTQVATLLAAAVAEDSIADEQQVLSLQAAYAALSTAAEREYLDELAETLSTFLALIAERPAPTVKSNRKARERLMPWFGAECLEAD
jgi:hypothetical protein